MKPCFANSHQKTKVKVQKRRGLFKQKPSSHEENFIPKYGFSLRSSMGILCMVREIIWGLFHCDLMVMKLKRCFLFLISLTPLIIITLNAVFLLFLYFLVACGPLAPRICRPETMDRISPVINCFVFQCSFIFFGLFLYIIHRNEHFHVTFGNNEKASRIDFN